jgi:hypothetical protein
MLVIWCSKLRFQKIYILNRPKDDTVTPFLSSVQNFRLVSPARHQFQVRYCRATSLYLEAVYTRLSTFHSAKLHFTNFTQDIEAQLSDSLCIATARLKLQLSLLVHLCPLLVTGLVPSYNYDSFISPRVIINNMKVAHYILGNSDKKRRVRIPL